MTRLTMIIITIKVMAIPHQKMVNPLAIILRSKTPIYMIQCQKSTTMLPVIILPAVVIMITIRVMAIPHQKMVSLLVIILRNKTLIYITAYLINYKNTV